MSRLALALVIVLTADVARGQPKPAPFNELNEEEPEPTPKPRPDPDAVPEDEPPPEPSGSVWPEAIAWMQNWKPRFATRHVRADFEVWPDGDVDSYTWDIVLLLGVEDAPVYGDVIFPFTYITEHDSDVDKFHVGNPTLGIHGGGVIADIVGLWGGLSVSIPTLVDLEDEDDLLSLVALSRAAGMRGLVEGHRFFPLTVPVRWGMGVEVQILPFLYFRTELFPVFYVYLKELRDATDRTYSALLDHISEIEALSPIGLGGGLRFQEAFNLRSSGGIADDDDIVDDAQVALEPFIAYQPPLEGPYSFPLFARFGVLIALDDPLGLDGAELVTVRTSVGVRF